MWTVNKEKYMKKFCELGVDALITNYPDKAGKMKMGSKNRERKRREKKTHVERKTHASFGFSFGLNNVVGTAASSLAPFYNQKRIAAAMRPANTQIPMTRESTGGSRRLICFFVHVKYPPYA